MKYNTYLGLAALLLGAITQVATAQTPSAVGMGAPAGVQQQEANPPVIDAFKFEGNQKITTAQLMNNTTMKTGVKISKELVGGEIRRIIGLYKAAGLNLSISPDIQHPADGHVIVTFKIDENGKVGDAAGSPTRNP